MIGSGRPNGQNYLTASPAAMLAALLTLTMFACGSNGFAGATLPSDPGHNVPSLVGTVSAPNGDLVSARRPWWSPDSFGLVQKALAADNVLTVGEGIPVSLSLVNPVDAADGLIGNTGGYAPLPLGQAFTDFAGKYQISDQAAGDITRCRLMVSVGTYQPANGIDTRMRSFVFDSLTNINSYSEAAVRVVLERLIKAPAVQLCDITLSGLQNIYDAVEVAAIPAVGDTVAELNQDAFELARSSPNVQQAVAAATGGS